MLDTSVKCLKNAVKIIYINWELSKFITVVCNPLVSQEIIVTEK